MIYDMSDDPGSIGHLQSSFIFTAFAETQNAYRSTSTDLAWLQREIAHLLSALVLRG